MRAGMPPDRAFPFGARTPASAPHSPPRTLTRVPESQAHCIASNQGSAIGHSPESISTQSVGANLPAPLEFYHQPLFGQSQEAEVIERLIANRNLQGDTNMKQLSAG